MSSDPRSTFLHAFQSRFGEVAVVWTHGSGATKVLRIFLSSGGIGASRLALSRYPDPVPGSDRRILKLEQGIGRLFAGEEPEFTLEVLDMDSCSGFQRRVLLAESRIPRGEVRSYRWLAQRTCTSSHARAVGAALAGNPFPLVIPCHRTVRSDGSLGGYQGGRAMKRSLLEMEGARFLPGGRLVLPGDWNGAIPIPN